MESGRRSHFSGVSIDGCELANGYCAVVASVKEKFTVLYSFALHGIVSNVLPGMKSRPTVQLALSLKSNTKWLTSLLYRGQLPVTLASSWAEEKPAAEAQ